MQKNNSMETELQKLDPQLSIRLNEIIDCHSGTTLWPERLLRLSEEFIDLPYITNPLKGSPTEVEELTLSLTEFDCVTLIETVLALANAHDAQSTLTHLIAIRYRNSVIKWDNRNHYSADWISANQDKGYIKDLTPLMRSVAVHRKLSALPGYPVHNRTLHFLPVEGLADLMPSLNTGDLIYFGTTRSDLDISHVGLLWFDSTKPLLRHASRSQKRVLDEPLDSFLERFGATPGVIIARPMATNYLARQN